jgi:hypothetical protein
MTWRCAASGGLDERGVERGTGPRRAGNADRSVTVKPDLSLIFPAYNEIQRIGSTLEAVRGFLDAQGQRYELFVCADGADGTRERALEVGGGDPRLTVLGSDRRGGKGRGSTSIHLAKAA